MRKVFCAQAGIEVKKRFNDLRKEAFRKGIHICTAFVPFFLHHLYVPTLCLLVAAGVLYAVAEYLRGKGRNIPLISDVTAAAARTRDEHTFVLGPVTLVAGILVTALLWSERAAAAGIYALAFGDGLASLAGKTFGRVHIPFTFGKTAAGSLTCFAAIFCTTFFVSGDCSVSLVIALVGMAIEMLPLKDFDNLIIPVLLGGIAQRLLPLI